MDQLPVTDRTKLRRHPERARLDRAALDTVLDQGLVVHVGFAGEGGQPFVIPTTYVRLDRTLYLHGAVASRMLRAGDDGIELCATVTLLDGLVLARSAFSHSMNYRSAVIVGRARLVGDPAEKTRVLAALVDRLIPGRMATARPPSPQELKQTAVLALPLEEASVKVRTGPPLDDQGDLGWPAWAGVIPLAMVAGPPQPAAGTVGAPPARTLAGPTEGVAMAQGRTVDCPRNPQRVPNLPRWAPAGDPPTPDAIERRFGDWVLSDDRSRVDFARVTGWLAGSYWCPGIPRAVVEQAARHSSLVAGAYAGDGTQVGHLRVVSDCTRFANIMDVFVAEPARGRGLGRALVRFALEHPAHRAISRWQLGTRDAHGVYEHEGFRALAFPERFMERVVAATSSDPLAPVRGGEG